MEGVEEVKGERRFWSVERRGIPTHPQELAVMLYLASSTLTSTELDIHMVGAVGVDDKDPLEGNGGRAGGMLMAEVETEAQFEKACALKKTILPNLRLD